MRVKCCFFVMTVTTQNSLNDVRWQSASYLRKLCKDMKKVETLSVNDEEKKNRLSCKKKKKTGIAVCPAI